MKTIKIIDFWINVVLILFFAAISIFRLGPVMEFRIPGLGINGSNLITGYFVVGGWQVLSMLVHIVAGWFAARGSARLRYTIVVLIVILLTSVCLLNDSFLAIFLLYPLLLLAPLMALGYTLICYREVFIKMRQRPMDLLK